MKKILLYAVLLFTAIGCQKSTLEVDNNESAENLVSITIQAALSGSSDTRAAVTPDQENDAWKSSWEADDKLTLVDGLGNVTALETILIDEDGIATFTGNVAVGEYEVYCVDKYTIDGDGSLLVDYSAQVASDKCTKMPLKANFKLTVSEENTNDCTDLVFCHLAQVMELKVSFAEVDAEYTLSSIEISGAQGDVADYYGFETASLSFNDVTISSNDELFSTYCYLPEFTIANEEEITLQAKLDKGGSVYVAECSITNSTGAEVVFEAGKHNYLTAAFSEIEIANWIDYAATSFANDQVYEAGVDSYTISTAEELALLAKLVNEGNDMTDKTFTLGNNIDLSGKEWVAIGVKLATETNYFFQGTFDGAEKTISGLYIDQPNSNYYQGLFGQISGATIQNVSVSGSVIGKQRVGGIVGYSYKSSVTNCYNSATVEGENNNVGGVVGYSNSSSSVTNCYNKGAVTGSSEYVGGVVGYSASSSVTNCYNTATVKGSNRVGGVVGSATSSSSVTNSYSSGAVTGSNRVGGVVGISIFSSSTTNCYWASDATDTDAVNGIGTTSTSEIIPSDEGTTAKTTSEMQAAEFAALLNNNAYSLLETYPDVCAWIAVSESYPTLDFGGTPTYTSTDE